MLQGVIGTFPCRQQMVKYGYKETAECTLCKKAHEESGSSWNRELPKRQLAIFRVWDAWDKRKWSLQHTMRASGSCYRKWMDMGSGWAWEGGQAHETPHD